MEKVCQVSDCTRAVLGRELCSTHYTRRRNGLCVDARCVGCGGPLFYATTYWCCCSVKGCERKNVAGGLCQLHLGRLKHRRTLDDPPAALKRTLLCKVDRCSRPYYAKGFCSMHWRRSRGDKGVRGPARLNAKRGSGSVNPDGYRVLTSNYAHALEHRLVMARILGRDLLPGENVHHINGDRLDNRPENLELWSTSQPPGQRVTDKVRWAADLLALYAPDLLADSQRLAI